MLPCLPVAKATRSWHAPGCSIVSEPVVRATGTSQRQQRRPKSRNGMVETTKNPGDKTLSVAPTKTLTLKPRGVEQGVVRQSFSHGRTKAVVVEKLKRRVGGPIKAEPPPSPKAGTTAQRSAARPAPVPPAAAPATVPAQSPAVAAPKPSGVGLRTLTEDEQKARVHALADARLREAEERKIAEEEDHVRIAR